MLLFPLPPPSGRPTSFASGEDSPLPPCAALARGGATSGAIAGALGDAALRFGTAVVATSCFETCITTQASEGHAATSCNDCASTHLEARRRLLGGSQNRDGLAERNRLGLKLGHVDGDGRHRSSGLRRCHRLRCATGDQSRRARHRRFRTTRRLWGVESRTSRQLGVSCDCSRHLRVRSVRPRSRAVHAQDAP